MPQRPFLEREPLVRSQVIEPNPLGVHAPVLGRVVEEHHVGLHPLGVEDAGGQAQDGVQPALVHDVAPDVSAHAGFKQHVVGQHHGGAATGFEQMLDEHEEEVGGFLGADVGGEVGLDAGFLGAAEGRVGEHHVHPVGLGDFSYKVFANPSTSKRSPRRIGENAGTGLAGETGFGIGGALGLTRRMRTPRAVAVVQKRHRAKPMRPVGNSHTPKRS